MLQVWRQIAAALRTSRRWHWLGAAFSLTLIVMAASVLFRILRDLNTGEVLAALDSVDKGRIVLAAIFIGSSYLTLTFYDFFALRTIGRRDIRYPTAALAGFASYAVGHNTGATAFTCAIIRYHLYAASGLTVTDVAKVCFVTGLTFWLGNIFVLGFGLAYDPQTASLIDQLPAFVNRVLGLGLLGALVTYVAVVSIKPRVVGRNRWQVVLPGSGLTVLQIAIGVADLTCCAAAMYVLMPDAPSIGFMPLMVVFVSALLLGYASHAPSGIGVFDAAMLLALSNFPKEDLIARLMLFRLVGYIGPGLVALVVLGLRQAWLATRPVGSKI